MLTKKSKETINYHDNPKSQTQSLNPFNIYLILLRLI